MRTAVLVLAVAALPFPAAADEIPTPPVPSLRDADDDLAGASIAVLERAARDACPEGALEKEGLTGDGLSFAIAAAPDVFVPTGDETAAVAVRVAMTNASGRRVVLLFPSSGVLSYVVRASDGSEVTTIDSPVVVATMMTHVTLKPGQTRSAEYAWPGRRERGRPLPPGRYELSAKLWARSCGALSLPAAYSAPVAVELRAR